MLNGEIVVLDQVGRFVFSDVISRMHTKGEARIKIASKKLPAVTYLFDSPFLDGYDLTKKPLKMRQKWIRQIVPVTGPIRASESIFDRPGL